MILVSVVMDRVHRLHRFHRHYECRESCRRESRLRCFSENGFWFSSREHCPALNYLPTPTRSMIERAMESVPVASKREPAQTSVRAGGPADGLVANKAQRIKARTGQLNPRATIIYRVVCT